MFLRPAIGGGILPLLLVGVPLEGGGGADLAGGGGATLDGGGGGGEALLAKEKELVDGVVLRNCEFPKELLIFDAGAVGLLATGGGIFCAKADGDGIALLCGVVLRNGVGGVVLLATGGGNDDVVLGANAGAGAGVTVGFEYCEVGLGAVGGGAKDFEAAAAAGALLRLAPNLGVSEAGVLVADVDGDSFLNPVDFNFGIPPAKRPPRPGPPIPPIGAPLLPPPPDDELVEGADPPDDGAGLLSTNIRFEKKNYNEDSR